MARYPLLGVLFSVILSSSSSPVLAALDEAKHRIVIVSSYHREYLWSQDTNRGVVQGLVDFGWLDDLRQGQTFTESDHLETSRAVVKKLWMDTKRRNGRGEIQSSVARVIAEIERFRPDIILLGDDNATNFVGNYYVDTDVPVVFWGVNGTPLKYDLVDSIERPGHNITGVYQAGYLREGLESLKQLLPHVRTFAVLSDDSPTGRAKAKALLRMARGGELPLELVDVVITNSVETWKRRALELEPQVDAFFVLNHNTLEDRDGRAVDQLEIGAWYLRNIHKPDVGHERQFVVEGMMAAVDDSGYKQGYEAVRLAHRILVRGEAPAAMAIYAPERGPFVVNLERAETLGYADIVARSPLVEDRVERCLALDVHPEPGRSPTR